MKKEGEEMDRLMCINDKAHGGKWLYINDKARGYRAKKQPLEYEDIKGKSIVMQAYSYQALWQAMVTIEERLQLYDGPDCILDSDIDNSIDPLLKDVYKLLSIAALLPHYTPKNRPFMDTIWSKLHSDNADLYRKVHSKEFTINHE